LKKPETPPPDDENKYTDYVDPKSKYAMATPTPPTPLNLFGKEKMVELLAQGLTPIGARFVLGISIFSFF
jgi:hypothetical protein